MTKLVLALALFCIGTCIQLISGADPEYTHILKIKDGKVRGVIEDVGIANRKIAFYEGIRYGKSKFLFLI